MNKSFLFSLSLLTLSGLSVSTINAETLTQKVKRYAKPSFKIAGGIIAAAHSLACVGLAVFVAKHILRTPGLGSEVFSASPTFLVSENVMNEAIRGAALFSSISGAVSAAILSALAFKSAASDLKK